MSFNNYLNDIVGKKISHVVTFENKSNPPTQVYIVFDDGTSFEFYGDIQNAKGLCRAGHIDGYKIDQADTIRKVYPSVGGSDFVINQKSQPHTEIKQQMIKPLDPPYNQTGMDILRAAEKRMEYQGETRAETREQAGCRKR